MPGSAGRHTRPPLRRPIAMVIGRSQSASSVPAKSSGLAAWLSEPAGVDVVRPKYGLLTCFAAATGDVCAAATGAGLGWIPTVCRRISHNLAGRRLRLSGYRRSRHAMRSWPGA